MIKMKHLYPLILLLFFSICGSYGQNLDAEMLAPNRHNDSDPQHFFKAESGFFFTAVEDWYVRNLYFSDGTPGNTRMVHNIGLEFPEAVLMPLEIMGDLLFFKVTENYSNKMGLWVNDGTEEGSRKILDLSVQHLFVYNNKMFFQATGEEGAELWVSDGTAEGTKLVLDLQEGTGSSRPAAFFEFHGLLYFTANDGSGEGLWKTDGTAAGTSFVAPVFPNDYGSFSPDQVLEYKQEFFFISGSDHELYKSDGTTEGTRKVKEINGSGGAASHLQGTTTEDGLLFLASDGINGFELWKSDGTAEGTGMLKDINPEGDGFFGYGNLKFVKNGSTVYFVAEDGVHSQELWKTDGTAEGTMMVKDLAPGDLGSFPVHLEVYNGKLMFFAHQAPEKDFNLWITDGTESGTTKLSEEDFTFNLTTFYFDLFEYSGKIYFAGNSEFNGRELWVSDGTVAGTELFLDINHSFGVGAKYLQEIDGLLYYMGVHSALGYQLRITNGSQEGSKLVKEINPLGGGSIGEFGQYTSLNGKLIFSAKDGVHGNELWISDGTATGTRMLKDIRPGSQSGIKSNSDYYSFIRAANRVYFMADEGTGKQELWATDGTTEGTTRLTVGIEIGGIPRETIVESGDRVYYWVRGASGTELWKTDGTPAGTVKLMLLDQIEELHASSDKLYLLVKDPAGSSRAELWISDGTEAGTRKADPLADTSDTFYDPIVVFKDELYYEAITADGQKAVYKTDGTTEGTVKLADGFYDYSFKIKDVLASGDHLYFLEMGDLSVNSVLWRTAGTPESTMRIELSADVKTITGMTSFQEDLYFQATGNYHGIWRVDAGTGEVAGLPFTLNGKAPTDDFFIESIFGTSKVFYIKGRSDRHGSELYAIHNGSLASLPVEVPAAIPDPVLSLRVSNETCAGKENGILEIETSEEYPFVASLNGETHDFTKDLKVEALPAGDYSICITTPSVPGFSQCFEFRVAPGYTMEGSMKAAKTSEGILVKVSIDKGTAPFLASLDGRLIGSYDSAQFSVLTTAKGRLEITSGKACEGILALDVEKISLFVAYPNPAGRQLHIKIPETTLPKLPVHIYNGSGQLVSSEVYIPRQRLLTIDVQHLSPGNYFAVIQGETSNTIKFSKK